MSFCCRTSQEVRGLKRHFMIKMYYQLESHPFMGVWIET